jgi:tRNA A-37 threonylcarbamoyl transferase component Bud32
VYKVRERDTGIERALKAFYPERNVNSRASSFYARKLHKLRNCPILIQYHTEETIRVRRTPVKLLVSEFIEGEILSAYLERQPGKRIHPFLGLHLLHELARGVERIHAAGEYHGDLHTDNVIVRRIGLSFDVKLIDFYFRETSRAENRTDDLCDLIRIFYDAIGGQKQYARSPAEVKAICRGLKRTLILSRFRSVRMLRRHLETMRWE